MSVESNALQTLGSNDPGTEREPEKLAESFAVVSEAGRSLRELNSCSDYLLATIGEQVERLRRTSCELDRQYGHHVRKRKLSFKDRVAYMLACERVAVRIVNFAERLSEIQPSGPLRREGPRNISWDPDAPPPPLPQ